MVQIMGSQPSMLYLTGLPFSLSLAYMGLAVLFSVGIGMFLRFLPRPSRVETESCQRDRLRKIAPCKCAVACKENTWAMRSFSKT